MTWIKSDRSIADHPKVWRLADALGVSEAAAIGHLHMFWWWAIDRAEDGCLCGYRDAELARAARCDPAAGFVAAMIDSGLIDRDEAGTRIHDWADYYGEMAMRRSANAERQRRTRSRRDAREASQPGDQPAEANDLSREVVSAARDMSHQAVTVTRDRSKKRVTVTGREEKRQEEKRQEERREDEHRQAGSAPPRLVAGGDAPAEPAVAGERSAAPPVPSNAAGRRVDPPPAPQPGPRPGGSASPDRPSRTLNAEMRAALLARWASSGPAGEAEDQIDLALSHRSAKNYDRPDRFVNDWLRRWAGGRSAANGSGNSGRSLRAPDASRGGDGAPDPYSVDQLRRFDRGEFD